ncbi:MAG: hypothetical protein IKP50_05265 [Bacilli bacterium]|nr:hypothetical protein [Bacilli bacterium]
MARIRVAQETMFSYKTFEVDSEDVKGYEVRAGFFGYKLILFMNDGRKLKLSSGDSSNIEEALYVLRQAKQRELEE